MSEEVKMSVNCAEFKPSKITVTDIEDQRDIRDVANDLSRNPQTSVPAFMALAAEPVSIGQKNENP